MWSRRVRRGGLDKSREKGFPRNKLSLKVGDLEVPHWHCLALVSMDPRQCTQPTPQSHCCQPRQLSVQVGPVQVGAGLRSLKSWEHPLFLPRSPGSSLNGLLGIPSGQHLWMAGSDGELGVEWKELRSPQEKSQLTL